jgi:hypothetical protein
MLEDLTTLLINKNCVATIHKKGPSIMVVFTIEPKKGPEVVQCISVRDENGEEF